MFQTQVAKQCNHCIITVLRYMLNGSVTEETFTNLILNFHQKHCITDTFPFLGQLRPLCREEIIGQIAFHILFEHTFYKVRKFMIERRLEVSVLPYKMEIS